MRKILIVGGGQSGLQLALGLLQHEYEVTLMSSRTAQEIRRGRVMSTQAMFDSALQIERDLGLNFWEDETPPIEGIGVSVAAPDGGRALDWVGWFERYAQSVDQRVKMSGWMDVFESRGGKLVIHGVTVSDLDRLAGMFDLVLVAAGKGELVDLFDRDASRSPYSTPQRALSVVYVHGLAARPEHPSRRAVRINLIPGVGELFMIPALTVTGSCDIMFFEGIPGGPLDCWDEIRAADDHLEHFLELMKQFVPWEYERCGEVVLSDSGGVLSGRYPPIVRHPVGQLPSGDAVLGMADVVVANDPIVGQGSNNACKCAGVYLDSILEHGDRPYDEEFMQRTFDSYWSYAQHPTLFSNAMLQPPPPHALEVLGAAGQHQEIADRFTNGFNDTADLVGWFLDPERAQAYLAEVQERHDRAASVRYYANRRRT
ncbi:MAG: styrene monooxygenase/indole monooxygenase family protein [Carbonactinosporaceae bacterium]